VRLFSLDDCLIGRDAVVYSAQLGIEDAENTRRFQLRATTFEVCCLKFLVRGNIAFERTVS